MGQLGGCLTITLVLLVILSGTLNTLCPNFLI